MKKNQFLMIAIYLIIAVVYNILVFTISKEHSSAFWSAYLFTMFAVIAACVTYVFAFKGSKNTSFLNLPLTIVATTYFVIQLLLGVIFMIIPNMNLVATNVIQIILLAVFSVIAIGGLIGKNVIVDSEREVREKVFYIKSLAAEVEGLIELSVDSTQKKVLTDLYEIIRYSDPMSHQSLGVIENKISAKVSALADVMNSGAGGTVEGICADIERLVADRNRQCKLLK